MFTNCIRGTFSKCATVLITHQLTFVRRCHKVAILDGGEFKVSFSSTCPPITLNHTESSAVELVEHFFVMM
jgi:ABC-type methionine transport system ATPase subunit